MTIASWLWFSSGVMCGAGAVVLFGVLVAWDQAAAELVRERSIDATRWKA